MGRGGGGPLSRSSSRRVARRFLAGTAILVPLALGAWIAADWTVLRRAATYPRHAPVTRVDWYVPTEDVPGGSAAPLPRATAVAAGISPDALRAAEVYAAERNSVALIVLRGGEVVLERYWHGHGPENPTNSMSMSKTVLGLLVGIALADGTLGSVEDSIADYLPEWAGDARARITLEDLLRMQSGLRHDERRFWPWSDVVRLHFGTGIETLALGLEPDRPPGTDFEYDNLNSLLLSLALERATGTRYARYLSERLWAPLGNADARVWLDRPGGTVHSYCCLLANAMDWARVGELMRNRGLSGDVRIVPEAWIERMLEPSPLDPSYGYHVWMRAAAPASAGRPPSPSFYYLDGRLLQRVYVIPSLDVVIVRLGEQPPDWDDLDLPATIAAGILPAAGAPATAAGVSGTR